MPQMIPLTSGMNDFSDVLRGLDAMGDATITSADSRLFRLAIPGGLFFKVEVDGLTTEVADGRICVSGGAVSWIRLYDAGGSPLGAVRNISLDGAVLGAWLKDEWSHPGSTALEDWINGAEWQFTSRNFYPSLLAPVVTADGVAITLDGDDSFSTLSGNDTVDTGPGDDHIRVRAGLNHVMGGDGNDDIGGGGVQGSVFLGGNGDDIIRVSTASGATGPQGYGGDGRDSLEGGDGADPLNGDGGNDVIDGFAGNDSVFGGHGDDRLDGNIGNDLLVGGGGADICIGGAGDDALFGGKGNDTLSGAERSDTLSGGQGADVMTGGLNVDVFLFSTPEDLTKADAPDVITDFATGADVIDLTGLGVIWRGEGAFVAGETQARWSALTGRIVLDTDGNGTGDRVIVVQGDAPLGAGDVLA